MAARRRREIPRDLAQAQERFEAWRRTRTTKARIPDRLWLLAVKLVGKYGLSRTASTLRLDYYSLKNRSEANDDPRSDRVSPRFIEVSPPVTAVRECVIELRDDSGMNLRIELKGYEASDVASVGCRLRNPN